MLLTLSLHGYSSTTDPPLIFTDLPLPYHTPSLFVIPSTISMHHLDISQFSQHVSAQVTPRFLQLHKPIQDESNLARVCNLDFLSMKGAIATLRC
jgi:hypothetical protein